MRPDVGFESFTLQGGAPGFELPLVVGCHASEEAYGQTVFQPLLPTQTQFVCFSHLSDE